MAHTAAIGPLFEELVKATIKTSSEAQLEQYKRAALRTFAESQSGRINQFDIHARLDGLEEKARILNNDSLADALHLRLAELSSRSDQWTPEILSLLLQLSDRPVHNTKVEDLVLLEPDPSPATLTWSDIVAEDPLDNQDGIWDNVDLAGDGSDEDEVFKIDRSDDSEHTPDSSLLDSEIIEAKLEDLTWPDDDSGLREIVETQFWKPNAVTSSAKESEQGKDHAPKLLLTEVQAIREVIFMLLGLPTSTFTLNGNEKLLLSPRFWVRHLSQESITNLLQELAEIGDKLRIVRRWVERETAVPLEQTFQAAIESRLRDFHDNLNEIQANFLKPQLQFTPSFLQLYDEVYRSSRVIQQIHGILMDLKLTAECELPFGILECLFEKTCANQSIGDADGYESMAKLFFECFRTYLRPIQSWMETGQLSKHDRVMFVRKSPKDVPLSFMWQEQYHLIRRDKAKLHAPTFLHVAAMKIFNTGKSVNFLKHLGYEEDKSGRQSLSDYAMTFENVCQPAGLGMLSPFPELFDMAFDTWIASKHRSSSLMLRKQLESECGLQKSLDALEFIYFFRNGALSLNIALKIFERIDHGNCRWNDNFVLTELFQETFSATACIDLDSLDVRSNATAVHDNLLRARRSMGALEDLRVTYMLPWPIANIIKTESLEIYQHIFVLLIQLQRAKYLLQMQKLPKNISPAVEKYLLLMYSLHHRLLWFTDTVLTYVTDMVLLASTIDMRLKMMSAEDVDAMIAVHEAYISQVQDRCFFTKQHGPIRQAITSLLDLTVLFSDIQASFVTQIYSGRPEYHRTRESKFADLDSEDDEDNAHDAGKMGVNSVSNTELPNIDRLKSMSDTFRKLHGFVAAVVQGVSKADSAPCWEMLANSLAVGLGK